MISSQILGLLLCRWAHSLYFAPQVELVPDPLRVEPNEPLLQVEYFPHSTTIIEGKINVVGTGALTFNSLSFTWRSSLELDHSSLFV